MQTAPTGPASLRPVSPLMLDGGTRMRLDHAPSVFDFPPPWLRAWQHTRHESRGRWMHLRTPAAMPPWYNAPPSRQLAVRARANADGTRWEMQAEGLFYLVVGFREEMVELQLAKQCLWGVGFRDAASYAMRVACECVGTACSRAPLEPFPLQPHVSTAHKLGWRITGVEMCRDFVGLDLDSLEARNFVNRNQVRLNHATIGGAYVCTGIEHGRRSAAIQLVIYDKTHEVESEQDGDDSTYRATWIAGGWDVERITRVELRFTGRGLTFVDKDTGGVYQLRDPGKLVELAPLAWDYGLQTKRLLVRPSDAKRSDRIATAATWKKVQTGCTLPRVRQARQMSEDAERVAAERASQRALRGCLRIAALHDRPMSTTEEIGEALAWAIGWAHANHKQKAADLAAAALEKRELERGY